MTDPPGGGTLLQPDRQAASGRSEDGPCRRRNCTWERGTFTSRRPIFVGITQLLDNRQDQLMGSHVRREGSTHMGATFHSAPKSYFLMIPRFYTERIAYECATSASCRPRTLARFPTAPRAPCGRGSRSGCRPPHSGGRLELPSCPVHMRPDPLSDR